MPNILLLQSRRNPDTSSKAGLRPYGRCVEGWQQTQQQYCVSPSVAQAACQGRCVQPIAAGSSPPAREIDGWRWGEQNAYSTWSTEAWRGGNRAVQLSQDRCRPGRAFAARLWVLSQRLFRCCWRLWCVYSQHWQQWQWRFYFGGQIQATASAGRWHIGLRWQQNLGMSSEIKSKCVDFARTILHSTILFV